MENDLKQSDNVTPREIWATLGRISQANEKLSRQMMETDRQMKETDEQIKENALQMKETDRQMKETDRRLKKLDELFNTQWGKLIESLVEGKLVVLLRERGIDVKATFTNYSNEDGAEEQWEFDIVAENGEEAVVVEVKTSLRVKDVDYFLNKLSKLKTWTSSFKDKRVHGAVAYLRVDEYAGKYAERKGLFVIRATGDSASIINRGSFRPRAFD